MQPASTDSVVSSPVLVVALVTVGCCLHYRAVSDQIRQESGALTAWCAAAEAVASTSESEAATATKLAER